MSNKALIIAINYVGFERGELRGCISDAATWGYIAQDKFGFKKRNVKLLLEEKATLAAMQIHILEILGGSQSGDNILITYSGHGTQVRDQNGDERDGMDEALCPYDYQENGFLIDDWLTKAIRDNLHPNAQLTVILDCCHAGTFNDDDVESKLVFRHLGRSVTQSNVSLFTGSKSNQTSADAYIKGDYKGAFTASTFGVLEEFKYNLEQSSLLYHVTEKLQAEQYTQIPTLQGSKSKVFLKN